MKFPEQETQQTPSPSKPRLGYRPDEVAGYLGISTSTLNRAIRRGDVQVLKIGKRTNVIPAPVLQELLKINNLDVYLKQ